MRDSPERIVRRLARTNPINAEYMICDFCRGKMRDSGTFGLEPDRRLDHKRNCVWLRAKRWAAKNS